MWGEGRQESLLLNGCSYFAGLRFFFAFLVSVLMRDAGARLALANGRATLALLFILFSSFCSDLKWKEVFIFLEFFFLQKVQLGTESASY